MDISTLYMYKGHVMEKIYTTYIYILLQNKYNNKSRLRAVWHETSVLKKGVKIEVRSISQNYITCTFLRILG